MNLDYRRIKRELPIERILIEYGIRSDLKQIGMRLYGRCPIHQGDNPKAFHASLDKNLWNCYTHCGGGSVIDLIMKLENIPARGAGEIGYRLLGLEITHEKSKHKKPNASLDFTLSLDNTHPYLSIRGLDIDTINHFGLGYCTKGIMEGRIAIPLHDDNDNLVGYCGRSVDETEPKYKFPKGLEKSKLLYNLNRTLKSENKNLIITEGYFDVFALYQAGFDGVALMGCSMSIFQKELIKSMKKRIILLFDGDTAGRRGMIRTANLLHDRRPLSCIYLPENTQPDSFSKQKLIELLH